MKEKEWKKWIFWFSFAVASIIVYKTIDSVSAVFLGITNFLELLAPFLMAILIAYILYIPAKRIEKSYKKSKVKFLNKHARGLSTIIVYICLIVIIFLATNVIIPTLSKSITDLTKNIPGYYTSAIDYLEELPEDSIITKLNVVDWLRNIETINIMQEIMNWFDAENLGQYIKGIVDATGIIFDLFVTIVVSVYLLLERDDIKSFLSNLSKAMFDKKTNSKLLNYCDKGNRIFYTFITSQVLDAIIVGTLMAIIMSFMNIEYAVLLGIFIGIFNVIPYFGAIVAVVVSVIITIFTGGFGQALWLAVVLIVVQQIDANIINPKILGTNLDLSPILVIFAVTVGGAYFGVLGMFLGVPVCALLKIIINDMIENKNKEKEKAV